MRTTIDESDELMKKAKIHAVNEGITLKQLFTRLLEQEFGVESEQSPKQEQSVKTDINDTYDGESKLDEEIEAMT